MKKLKLFVLILFILNPHISHADKPSVILENLTWMDAEKALQASLKRMNTKYIDLYYIMDRIAGSGYVGHGLSDPAKLTDDLREWITSFAIQ